MLKTNINEKINSSFNGPYGHIVCDWYFKQIIPHLENKSTLDYGTGNAKITNFCNVYTSDIDPNNFGNEDTLDFVIDKTSGKINTSKTFDVITVLRNYILYSNLEHFLKVINYLTTHLTKDGIILVGKHTIYDDFGDWNLEIEQWLNTNSNVIDKGITKFWIISDI